MLRVRPYKPSDAASIVSWIKDETAFRKWSADRFDKYPIIAEDLNAHYVQCNDDFFTFTAFDETGVVGHFILRFPDEKKQEGRLGFVIVDDTKRGKGYGKEMLTLALEFAFRILKVEKVTLGVFENNMAAYHCYKSVGFEDAEGSWSCHVMNEDWKCRELVIMANSMDKEKGVLG